MTKGKKYTIILIIVNVVWLSGALLFNCSRQNDNNTEVISNNDIPNESTK